MAASRKMTNVLAEPEEAQEGENNNHNQNDPKNRHIHSFFTSRTRRDGLRLRAMTRQSPCLYSAGLLLEILADFA